MKRFAIALLLSAAAAAAAWQAGAQQRPLSACKADREKLCPDTKPGDGKYGACMRQHQAELSPECAAAFQAVRENRRLIRMNCKADIDKFCADAQDGKGGVVRCLRAHETEVAQVCAEALKNGPVGSNG